jgi:hypothetical protein
VGLRAAREKRSTPGGALAQNGAMKKLLLVLGGGAALLLVLFLVVGLILPTDYSVSESVEIDATAAEVHVFVGELRKWPEWAPWEENDPTIVTTYGPTTTGVGASQSWTSETEGAGELTLTKCDPATGIAYDMAFIVGETRSPARADMSYAASGAGTTVTWSMEGDMSEMLPPVLDGYMTLLMPEMIGEMFRQGLDKLKVVVEAAG